MTKKRILVVDDSPDERRLIELWMNERNEECEIIGFARDVRRQLEVGDAQPTTFRAISELLTGHVRWEQHDVFPLIEQFVEDENLRELAAAGPRDI